MYLIVCVVWNLYFLNKSKIKKIYVCVYLCIVLYIYIFSLFGELVMDFMCKEIKIG